MLSRLYSDSFPEKLLHNRNSEQVLETWQSRPEVKTVLFAVQKKVRSAVKQEHPAQALFSYTYRSTPNYPPPAQSLPSDGGTAAHV